MFHAPARLAKGRDAARIAAERADLTAYPAQRRQHVAQRIIARAVMRRFGGQLGMGEKAEQAQPVIGGDHDHAMPRQLAAVIGRVDPRVAGSRSAAIAAAVKEDHHRQAAARPGPRRHAKVEGQTVLAAGGGDGAVGAGVDLRASRAIGQRPAHPAPGLHWDTGLPPTWAHRRHRERHALEDQHVTGACALQHARRRPDPHRRCACRQGRHRGHCEAHPYPARPQDRPPTTPEMVAGKCSFRRWSSACQKGSRAGRWPSNSPARTQIRRP